jgi:enoyl-CoA hydratase/carnithine racemase
MVDSELRGGGVVLTLNDAPRRNVLSGALCLALSQVVADADALARIRHR